MSNPDRNAIIKATGKKIKVYRHRENGTWINSADLETEYKKTELIINPL